MSRVGMRCKVVVTFIVLLCLIPDITAFLTAPHRFKTKISHIGVSSLHQATWLSMSTRAGGVTAASIAGSASEQSAPVILKAKGISKTYTQVPQFQDLDLQILQGQCVGMIGANGAGKSTLLKCLAGREKIDNGHIEIMSAYQALLYVPQDIENLQQYGFDLLFQAGEGSKKEQQKLMKALLKYYLHENSDLLTSAGLNIVVTEDDLATSMDVMTELDGWGIYSDFLDKLQDVNLSTDLLFKPLLQLSGGERKKLNLINAIMQQPKLLMLDEPTNHLDIDAIEWLGDVLMNAVRSTEMTIVLITHDRYFLDKACTNSKYYFYLLLLLIYLGDRTVPY